VSELPLLYQEISKKMVPLLMNKSSVYEKEVAIRECAHEETLLELIEHSDKTKECEKIMMKREMQEYCLKELNSTKDSSKKQFQRTLMNRRRKLV
jgi:hypothetical protein